MEMSENINLLTATTKLSPGWERAVSSLQRAAILVAGLFLLLSALGTGAYLFGRARYQGTVTTRDNARKQVDSFLSLEGILRSVKERVGVASKIVEGSTLWSTVLTRVDQMVPAPFLASITVDQKGKMTLTIKTAAIEELLPVIRAIVSEVENKHVVSAEMNSFQFHPEGGSTLVVSFVPVF